MQTNVYDNSLSILNFLIQLVLFLETDDGDGENAYTAMQWLVEEFILPGEILLQKNYYDILFAAFWKAAREVIPGVKMHGCSFHWSQAVIRRVQDLGLYRAFLSKGPVHGFLGKVLALQFLPANHIQGNL